jgi:hypothetical protein
MFQFHILIKTTGTKIIRYDDISNSITKKKFQINHSILFLFLTRQIEHFGCLWHMLNDNRFPKKYKIFILKKIFHLTNFLLAFVLCDKLCLNIFARFGIFIFTLIFGKTFSTNEKNLQKKIFD